MNKLHTTLGICLLILCTFAEASEPTPRVIYLDIGPQSLSDALGEFAKQTRLELVFRSDLGKGLTTPGLSGAFTQEAALEKLLANTGLQYAYLKEGVVAIRPIESVKDRRTTGDAQADGYSLRLAQFSASSPGNLQEDDMSEKGQESAALQEVVVTAERREDPVSKVPESILALPQARMDDLHIESLADLASITPGLYLAPSTVQDAFNYSIRGIFSTANAPTTQFYIDETPIAIRLLPIAVSSMSPQPLIFDLDRVEVLRGPQGTLFGASAMGGAIRFITPQPSLTNSSGFAKADAGFTDGGDTSYEVGAAYGAPIVDGKLGFRVSAWYRSVGGFIDQEDPYTGSILKRNIDSSDDYVVRPALTWAPIDGVMITPAFYMQHTNSENPHSYWLDNLPNTENGHHVWGGNDQPFSDNLRVASLAVKYDMGSISIDSDTSYMNRTLQAYGDLSRILTYIVTGENFYPGEESFRGVGVDISKNHAWTQEFRISSSDPSSRFSWVTGAFYRSTAVSLEQLWGPSLNSLTNAFAGQTSEEFFGNPDYVFNGQALNAYTRGTTTDVSEALFGDVSAKLTSNLNVSVGLRAEHLVVEDQESVFAGPLDGGYTASQTPDESSKPVTPQASITYQFNDNDMVYTNVSKGTRPGGGNIPIANSDLCAPSLHALGYTQVPSTFGPDSLWSYELGTKDHLFDRHLAIDASVYYVDWKNIQTSIGLPSCFGQSFTGNSGKAISQGFDLQISTAITHDLKVYASVGYTNAYYPNATYGAPDPNTGAIPLIIGAGQKIGVVPWTYAMDAEYSHDLSGLWTQARAYFRMDYRHLSAAPAPNPLVANYDPDNKRDQSYGLLNIRVGVTHQGLDLSAYVNNATNADPLIGYGHGIPGDPLHIAYAIQPLTAGLTAWYRF